VLNRRQWLLAAAAAPLASRSFGQQQPEELPEALIRVDVQVVNILATVRDKDGRLVNSLTKDDFEIYEDGELQDIQYFGRQTDLPLTIGLLVDTSVSQQRVVEVERSAGYQFFDEILRVDKDLAFLMSFENFNTTLMLVGSDAPLTIAMFDRLKEGSTPLLNAVSLLLMVGSSLLALVMIAFQRR